MLCTVGILEYQSTRDETEGVRIVKSKTVGITRFLREPSEVFDLVSQGGVVFITRRTSVTMEGSSRILFQGAIVSPRITTMLVRYYQEISTGWDDPLVFPISDFQTRFVEYCEDVSRNHIVRLTYRGAVVGSWISNNMFRDLAYLFPELVDNGWPELDRIFNA